MHQNEASIKDPQRYIEDQILGFDAPTFFNISLLGRDKFVSFTEMSASEARNFVDTVLDLGVFTDMAAIARDDYRTIKSVLDTAYTRDQYITETIATLGRSIAMLRGSIETAEKTARAGISADTEAVRVGNESIAKIKSSFIFKENTKGDSLLAIASLKEKTTEIENEIRRIRGVMLATAAIPEKERVLSELKAELVAIDERIPSLKEAITAAMEVDAAVKAEVKRKESVYNECVQRRDSAKEEHDQQAGHLRGFEQAVAKTKTDIAGIDLVQNCRECGRPLDTTHRAEVLSGLHAALTRGEGVAAEAAAKMPRLVSNLQEANAAVAEAKRDKDTPLEDSGYQELMFEGKTIAARRVDVLHSISNSESEIRNLKSQSGCDNPEESIRLLESSKAAHANDIAGLQDVVRNVDSTIAEIKKLEAEIETTKSRMANAIRTFRDTKAKSDSDLAVLSADVLKANEEQATIKQNMDEWFRRSNALNTIVSMLKDDGIKSKVTQAFVPFLTDRVNHYLDALGLWIALRFNSDFSVEMTSADRKGQTISDLSTGQSRRIDLAILLAWRDIARARASASTNLLVMDETLENLSAQGVSDFVDMFSAECPDTVLFVITQRAQEFSEYFDRSLKFSLRDGFSVMEESNG